MKNVTVIGAGEMGHGIAEVFAIGGYNVNLMDVDARAVEKGLSRIRESLDRLVRKGSMQEGEMKSALDRIHPFTDLAESVHSADMVIEAVPEIPKLKREVLEKAAASAPKDAIIGSNTSNIRIGDLAKGVSNPSRVLGMHFFNPAVVMKLVEIVRGAETGDEAVEAASSALLELGKTPVVVRRDRPGFIVNRINAADLLLFGLLQDSAVASPEEIDAFGRQQGLPMGPYELLDFVGIDIVKDSLDYFARELSPDYGSVKVFGRMVDEKKLGKKTGSGFYDWSAGRPRIDSSKATDRVRLLDIFAVEINEAVKLIEEGVASPDEIDTAVRLGMNRPFGPISVAKSLTNREVKEALERLAAEYSMPIFAPAKSIAEGRMREAAEGRVAGEKEAKAAPAAKVKEGGAALLVEEDGSILHITLNRPKYNMISPGLLSELDAVIERYWDSRDIRVVVVTGAGENFSSGAEMTTFIPGGPEFIEYARRGERTLRKLSEMPKITIAALKGYVLGGALELALSCDIRLSSENAVLAFPEVTRGLIPAWGGTQLLTRAIGGSRALALILTAERIDAAAALDYGITYRIVKDVDREAMEFARELAGNAAPVASTLAKRLVRKAAEGSSDIGLEMEAFAAGVLYGTEDLREGIGAFLQKRKAEFKGK